MDTEYFYYVICIHINPKPIIEIGKNTKAEKGDCKHKEMRKYS